MPPLGTRNDGEESAPADRRGAAPDDGARDVDSGGETNPLKQGFHVGM